MNVLNLPGSILHVGWAKPDTPWNRSTRSEPADGVFDGDSFTGRKHPEPKQDMNLGEFWHRTP